MRECIEALNGTLDAGPSADGGRRLNAGLPAAIVMAGAELMAASARP